MLKAAKRFKPSRSSSSATPSPRQEPAPADDKKPAAVIPPAAAGDKLMKDVTLPNLGVGTRTRSKPSVVLVDNVNLSFPPDFLEKVDGLVFPDAAKLLFLAAEARLSLDKPEVISSRAVQLHLHVTLLTQGFFSYCLS